MGQLPTLSNLPPPVQVDVARYARKWYQIRATPQFWDKVAPRATDATAEYTLCFRNGKPHVSVRNEFRQGKTLYYVNGELLLPSQEAVVAVKRGETVPGDFKVRFTNDTNLPTGVAPVPATYRVVALADDYRYAVVMSDTRAVWVLSHESTIDERDMAAIELAIPEVHHTPYTKQGDNAKPLHQTFVFEA